MDIGYCRVNEVYNDILEVYDDNGDPIPGYVDGDFTKQIFRESFPQPLIVTVTEIGNTGTYKMTCQPPTIGDWVIIIEDPMGERWAVKIVVTEFDIDILFHAEWGRWKIDENTGEWIIYKRDGSTEIFRFNLKDANGNIPTFPILTAPFEREVP